MRTNKVPTLELLILGLLNQAPRSGYDLRKILIQTPLRHYSDSPGSIYPALKRLIRRNWIDEGPRRGSRGRREFSINDRGRKALTAWLRLPVTSEDVIHRSEELSLRFAFMGEALSLSAVQGFLGEYERELASYLTILEQYHSTYAASFSLTGRLALEGGINQYQADLRWIRNARRAVEKRKDKQE
jgi:DNA-binding PadR family transcriptional regulator